MTLLTLGWATEFAEHGIAANCLWPQTMIATAAVSNVLGSESASRSRNPEIMADAALAVLHRAPHEQSGQTLIDADVLTSAGLTDLTGYGGGHDPEFDLFVESPHVG
ncbi:hypothetical protein [Streptomyces sp. NPDC006668]|uniref:hypothetical protein n=1 Tax=Streptomyces sp. NPDC006668 TaxID=3156903 RepID=UPI0034072C05